MVNQIQEYFFRMIIVFRRSSVFVSVHMLGSKWERKRSLFTQALSTMFQVVFKGILVLFFRVSFIFFSRVFFFFLINVWSIQLEVVLRLVIKYV